MPAPRRVVIVGASLAGLRTAQGLRDRGFDGRITLVGAEERMPYNRPPLSKSMLAGTEEHTDIELASAEEISGLQLDLRLGHTADEVDPVDRVVQLADGTALSYDALVVATGSAAWMPPGWGRLEGVHTLRTADDCLALRDDLRGSPRVAVVGGGFVGCEVASTMRGLGLSVSIIEPLPALMARAIGTETALACTGFHRDAGVRVICEESVAAVEGADRVERLRLTSGATVNADVVVVGVGARPVTNWLQGSSVEIGDGVLCDASCATSVSGIYAAGDVARWFNPRFGEAMRVEHWTNASEQGMFVGRAIIDGPASGPFEPVPFVWSDQHGIRIEIAGVLRAGDQMEVIDGSLADRRFVALFGREGRLSGALAFGSTRQMLRIRALLAKATSWEDALNVCRETTPGIV